MNTNEPSTITTPPALSARPIPRVLLDVDGVLADFISGALAIINRIYATAFTPAHVTEWDFMRALGLDLAGAACVKRAIGAESRLALKLAVYPGAIDGVRRLPEIADVYIVTSPWNSNPTWTHDRETWLQRHFSIPSSHVIHTSAKHLIAGDVLVDDKTSTCAEWQTAHPNGLAVRWDNLHNASDPWTGQRVASWDALLNIVASRRAS